MHRCWQAGCWGLEVVLGRGHLAAGLERRHRPAACVGAHKGPFVCLCVAAASASRALCLGGAHKELPVSAAAFSRRSFCNLTAQRRDVTSPLCSQVSCHLLPRLLTPGGYTGSKEATGVQ